MKYDGYLRKTAQTDKGDFKTFQTQMKYIDLHCDSVTACSNAGEKFASFSGQVNAEKLKKAGCFAQCFAIFTEGENAAEDYEKYSAFYRTILSENLSLTPIYTAANAIKAQREGKVAAILTVENAGFLKGDISGFARLKEQGVKMLSLVWNTPNAFAYPNLIFKGGVPDFSAREKRGLTEAGKEAVKELNRLKIIIDVSHLSDGGAEDVLALSSAPVVASHSNSHAVCPVSRNLTDSQLRRIADKGGVVGLNFCKDFIGCDDVFEGLLSHYKHITYVAGEDAVALGSDFDGIPRYAQMDDCTYTGKLLEYFFEKGVSQRMIEKLAYGNFLRVFGEVVG